MLTSLTHTVIQIILDISVTGDMSPQQITSLMALSYNGVPRNNTRHQEAVPMRKQEQCIQVCKVRTGLEFF